MAFKILYLLALLAVAYGHPYGYGHGGEQGGHADVGGERGLGQGGFREESGLGRHIDGEGDVRQIDFGGLISPGKQAGTGAQGGFSGHGHGGSDAFGGHQGHRGEYQERGY